ncbi:MAG: hypothetical protein COV34_00080 [Candidatus Zambryskibacteria bacterium CG10_big_fil_rev_8_21_14_0_10_42_12]|uniref:Nudix hydrolase domain-containing protein n=1 Tax=Candidatus Zambryskibacteria bacterium CG10_big_fil_rev_8_21_14_0_10_42_12 TaxID=1975115 RepID=A0A2H0QY64_9BACT|nr:MAG: hypothetical protein COV34_00080 [Candidatus Zambryskibacteria bacterium CG10_big_fil_rev_8_21_14_0_10_42_12]
MREIEAKLRVKNPDSVASAFIIYEKKLLLLQRDYNEDIIDPGCWQLPGGGVEDNETIDAAIQRELNEEIGIIPEALKFLTSSADGIHYAYYANLSKEEAKSVRKGSEGKDLCFFFNGRIV